MLSQRANLSGNSSDRAERFASYFALRRFGQATELLRDRDVYSILSNQGSDLRGRYGDDGRDPLDRTGGIWAEVLEEDGARTRQKGAVARLRNGRNGRFAVGRLGRDLV